MKAKKNHDSFHGAFITGTDTDVGKTYIACCIAKTLIKQGIPVTPRKPIASGCIPQENGGLLSEDAQFLQQACQSIDSLKTICPYQFEPAISPQQAIQEANLTITIQDLALACQNKNASFTMVEGAGGFYSPLALDGLNKDLAIQLKLPVILVVANRIGCINQTLLSIEAIQNSGLTLHSIIINQITNNNFNYAHGLRDYADHATFNMPYSMTGKPQIIKNWSL
jgi:dethiobiotin synthetase